MSDKDLCQKWLDVSDNELDTSTINDFLDDITDDLWVVAAVADRIIDNPSLLHDLLGIALKRSQGTVERLRNSFAFQDSQEICASGGQDSSSVHVDDDMVSYFRENSSDARICVLRSVLLDRKDRVETFMEMSAVNATAHGESDAPTEWDDDPWIDADAETNQQPPQRPPPLSLSTFLSQSLVDSACLLATRESFGSLQILFKRHGPSIWPYRLTILAFIPTHISPLCYQEVLPKLDLSRDEEHRSPVEAWRPELDWTENPSVQVALSTSGYDAPQSRLSTHSADEAPQPMSSQELAFWYRRRIQTILGSTGMVDVALSMVQHAASQGILELDELGEELSLLSRLVYDAQAAAEDGPEDDWTLEQWKNMDSLAVIHAMLALSTPQTVVADIRKFVSPYLFVLESRAERAGDPNPNLSLQLLNDFILGAPLGIVARIFEDSKPTLPLRHRLISDNEDMARLALACLYGSNLVDEWHIMSQIFECLPDWSGAAGEDFEDAVEMTITSLGTYVTPTTARPTCTPSDLYLFFHPLPLPSLSRVLDILDVHLESGEILSRWDTPAPLRWFLQSSNDKNSQRARAVRMARRPGTNHALHGQADWERLLEDMLKLCRTNDNGLRGAFGLLSQAEILSIFLSGLLSTGRKFPFPSSSGL
jgi:neuroblastoma-amplified sequence